MLKEFKAAMLLKYKFLARVSTNEEKLKFLTKTQHKSMNKSLGKIVLSQIDSEDVLSFMDFINLTGVMV